MFLDYGVSSGGLLSRYLEQGKPICLLGDFNQRCPPIARNKGVFPLLQEALQGRFKVWTEGKTDGDGKLLIDHVATTDLLHYELEELIPMVNHLGQALTDPVGAIGSLRLGAIDGGFDTFCGFGRQIRNTQLAPFSTDGKAGARIKKR